MHNLGLTGIKPDSSKLKEPFVLNEIAYNRKTKNLLITGKTWPKIYKIKLIEKNSFF
ncbi:MAG: glutaminyl-peptide cyclotransferase [Thermodesulfobacteriota bacterium]